MNKSSKTVTLKLSEVETNILIEALLFSTSINVGADWDEENIDKMVTLSKKLKELLCGNTKLNNIVFYREENYKDKWTQTVFDFFKEKLNIIELQDA
jgi:hypothetical protein